MTKKRFNQLSFRADPETDAKLVFFTEDAVRRVLWQGIKLSKKDAAELIKVLRRPGEVAAVLELQTKEKTSISERNEFLFLGPAKWGH